MSTTQPFPRATRSLELFTRVPGALGPRTASGEAHPAVDHEIVAGGSVDDAGQLGEDKVALAAAARRDLDLGEVEARRHGEDAHRAQPGATSRTNSERSAPRGCRATLCRTVRDTPTSRRA